MAAYTLANAAAFIGEVWTKKILRARYMAGIVAKRISLVNGSWGDIHHFPNVAAKAAATVTATTGAFTTVSATETDTTVTVNQWRAVPHEVPDNVAQQSSQYGLAKSFAPQLGLDLEEDLEELLLNEDANVASGNSAGTASAGFLDPELLNAIEKLDTAKVPMTDRTGLLLSTALRDIRKLDRYSLFESTGQKIPMVISGKSSIEQAPLIAQYYVGQLYGIPFWYHTRLNANNNMIFHKDAWGLVMQKDVGIESARAVGAGKLSTVYVAHHMFGLGTLRSDHAVVLHT